MRKITNEYDHVFGALKTSTIDYPKELSSVLYYNGCNLRCPYCHNADLALGKCPALISPEDIEGTLLERKGKIDYVVVTGGEPTMYSTVIWLTRRLKELGFKVKLDTNGLRPRIIEQCGIDYLALDLKALPERYEKLLKSPAPALLRLRESLELVKKMGDNAEVRITMAPGISEPSIVQTLKRMLDGVKNIYLQRANLDNVLDPTFFEGQSKFTDQDMIRARNALVPVCESVQIRW